MTTVAFDCSGTLLGRNRDKVVKLFRWFQSKNCDMIIWSGSYGFIQDAVELHNLVNQAELHKKQYQHEMSDDGWYNIAVDDDPCEAEMLAAKHFIMVHEIPDDESKWEELYGRWIK